MVDLLIECSVCPLLEVAFDLTGGLHFDRAIPSNVLLMLANKTSVNPTKALNYTDHGLIVKVDFYKPRKILTWVNRN